MLNISLHEPEVDSQGVEIQTKEHQGRNNKHHNPDDSHRDVRRALSAFLKPMAAMMLSASVLGSSSLGTKMLTSSPEAELTNKSVFS